MSAERAVAAALTPEVAGAHQGRAGAGCRPGNSRALGARSRRHPASLAGARTAGVEVGIAPTYSGCPATPAIKADVLRALTGAGFDAVAVDVLSPPWSTDWISAEGRRKLEAFGIAPPAGAGKRGLWDADPTVTCPRCGSKQTAKQSEFGSTPCKALYKCESCLEPFDYFKCI